jgi:hypothetical protein
MARRTRLLVIDAPVFTSTTAGSVPASGANATYFLRADGTWTLPTIGYANVTGLSDYIISVAGVDGGTIADGDKGDITVSSNGTVWEINSSALTNYALSAHTHIIADVTGLQTALDGKANTSHTHVVSDVDNLQNLLDAKAQSSHVHTSSSITDFEDAVTTIVEGMDLGSGGGTGVTDGDKGDVVVASSGTVWTVPDLSNKLNSSAVSAFGLTLIDDATAGDARTTLGLGTAATQASTAFAAASHTHAISDVTGLQTALDNKLDDSQASVFGLTLLDDADASTARTTLGLGTAATSATGDFATASHTHAISDVTGLQTALDNKLDDSQATAFGLSLLDDADASTARTTLGLGTAATSASSAFAASSHTHTHNDITDFDTEVNALIAASGSGISLARALALTSLRI